MLPRLLMPNSFCFPPLEYCRGTTPPLGSEVASTTKRCSVADSGYGGRGDQRAEAGDLA
jgi:hypothetical protein